jgi:hypothetical protein
MVEAYLDLVDGRGNFTRGIVEELLKVANLEIRHTDISYLACVEELLHPLPE